ncbi:peptidylprolyl isomerase domain and WD repeat-containing protein 1-like [Tetranychus urticae]|uniref:peptidylprolyl isomerase n=1 Tax=Tetranychus urticae TaxID=32264 RepID=T1K264_TETUR|nr:peptidylprolyl isomerase domain and WD repeat-containing protein 1-like [Tetranychus urticae]
MSKSDSKSLQKLLLDNLPDSENYERSFMHLDTITHVIVTRSTDFLITASSDGVIKFWKKVPEHIEFVKHYKAHRGPIIHIAASCDGAFLVSISKDLTMDIFDVINFDMINLFTLDFMPLTCEWIYAPGDALQALALSREDKPDIYIYDGKESKVPIKKLEKIHSAPVVLIRFNQVYSTVISVDKSSMIEYWSSAKHDYTFPDDRVDFKYKTDTDLYELAKAETAIHDLAFTDNGLHFATLSSDRKVRLFKFKTGKVIRIFDESLSVFSSLQAEKKILPPYEYNRRKALEEELERSEAFTHQTVCFDKSGTFLIYPTPVGIKVVAWSTNRCHRVLGKGENFRPIGLALYQGIPNKPDGAATLSSLTAENQNLTARSQADPSLFVTGFKKGRFYIFTRRDPEANEDGVGERDIFNEKPPKEVMIAAMESSVRSRIFEAAVIHTTMGDIHVKLFPKEAPKAVENFCVHSKNGYYNGHIFHRVIKQFMIQTGDPTGTGTGGESIWGHDFADEFNPSLKHDKPYTLSMANAGPNTNGSQFFITVIPCPWLDNKHTIFGRVVKGMETCQNISKVKTNQQDKPYDDIKIINIALK